MIMIKLLYYYNLHFRIISNEESGVKHSRHGDDIFKNRVVDLFEYSKGESFCRREIMKIGHDDVMTILLFCLWESQFFFTSTNSNLQFYVRDSTFFSFCIFFGL